MTDLVLAWNNAELAADLVMNGAEMATDGGLRSAVIASLFTDARARPDDPLPEPGADRRGWWGDVSPAIPGDRIGSRLWLLAREKQTAATIERARGYALEALAWLITDGIAASIIVTAEALRPGVLALGIEIARPDGPSRERFDFVWEANL